jgi:hypothetical protein
MEEIASSSSQGRHHLMTQNEYMTYKNHEDEAVSMLLKGLPEGSVTLKRSTIEKMIRAAFTGGWKNAVLVSRQINNDGIKVKVQ